MRAGLYLVAAVILGCAPGPRPEEPNPLESPPIDSVRVGGTDEVAAWSYREEAAADLDGDGTSETLVLAADVAFGPEREPLWEDGHRWALFVEPDRGARTMLYSAFVPNGRPTVAILQPDDRRRRRVLVEERAATELRVYEIEYAAQRARLSSALFSQVERWLAPRR